MELDKIRNLTDEELTGQQAKAAEQLFRLRFQKGLGNNEGIKKLRGLKLDIARIQTVARERTLSNGHASTPAVVAAPTAIKPAPRKKAKKD
jgi:large subunit ribosomal protein L29